jgi:hypothetical protein
MGLDRQLAAHLAVTRSLDDWYSFESGAETLLRRLGGFESGLPYFVGP